MADATTVDRRALARKTKPIPCYAVEQIPAKQGGEELYKGLATAVADGKAKLVEEVEIPPQDARSWVVKAGQMWRICCHKGPQVADMNCWSLEDPTEHFYTSKTRQIHATHLTTGDRLWSNMPYIRPLATITYDSIAYGFDDDNAGVHDVVRHLRYQLRNNIPAHLTDSPLSSQIGSRCDPYTNKLLTGKESHVCCHSNLTRQALRDGLTEAHVHDVLNVFMCTGFTLDTHQYFTKPVGLASLAMSFVIVEETLSVSPLNPCSFLPRLVLPSFCHFTSLHN